jgi:hypothetical protein
MKINSFSGKFSVIKGEIILLINDEEHNISNLFPKHNYSLIELSHPKISWKMRVKICKVVRKYVNTLDKDFPSDKIMC